LAPRRRRHQDQLRQNAESTLDHVFARNGLVLTISREGARLFAQLTGQPKARIYSHSESEFFFATAIDAWISFRTDGQADSLIFHHNGRDSAARRVDAAEAQAAEAAFRPRRTATEELAPAQTPDASSAGPYVGFYEAGPADVLVITKANGSLRN
jgi:serine-type D-Ala-D-Ala carboxypeptidase/endopeptidase